MTSHLEDRITYQENPTIIYKQVLTILNDLVKIITDVKIGKESLYRDTIFKLTTVIKDYLGFGRGEFLILVDKEGKTITSGEYENKKNGYKILARPGWDLEETKIVGEEVFPLERARGQVFWNVLVNGDSDQDIANLEYMILKEGISRKEDYFKTMVRHYSDLISGKKKDEFDMSQFRDFSHWFDTVAFPVRSLVTQEVIGGFSFDSRRLFSEKTEEIEIEGVQFHISQPIPDFIMKIGEETMSFGVSTSLEYLEIAENYNRQYLARVEAEQQNVILQKITLAGELTGDLSHNMRNTLNGIQQNIELVRVVDTDEERESYLTSSLRAIGSAVTYLNDMLVFSRGGNIEKHYGNINEDIKSTVSLKQPTLQNQGITLEMKLDESLPEVYHSSAALNQVILNLLLNSIEAIHKKKEQPVEYTPSITISSDLIDSKVKISVYDNGIGIQKDNISRIFDPSFTTKDRSNRKTGFGLGSCYKIINDHNGTITISSTYGVETFVDILLPIKES